MSRPLCRLCLGSERLVCMFDARLAHAPELRMCIVLCTGVDIKTTDEVSKMVCRKCCSVAVKLFKYRKNAVANDKALKELVGQKYVEPSYNKEEILELHSSIVESVSETRVADSIARFYDCADGQKDADGEELAGVVLASEGERENDETEAKQAEQHPPLTTKDHPDTTCEPPDATDETPVSLAELPTNNSEISAECPETPIPNATSDEIASSLPFVECPPCEAVTSQPPPDSVSEPVEDALNPRIDGVEADASFENPESSGGSHVFVANFDNHDLHPSVKQLLNTYPSIILSREVLASDVAPLVQVDKTEANEHLDRLPSSSDFEMLDGISSFRERFPDVDVVRISEPSDDNKVYSSSQKQSTDDDDDCDNEPITKLRLYRDRSLSSEQDVYRAEKASYYSDPDYCSERSFKTRKRKFDDVYDDLYSECDSDDGESETESYASTELTTRSSKSKMPKISYQTDSDSEYDFLGYPKTEECVRLCEYCDKVCYGRSQLRHHERTHRKCLVCHKVYRSDEALELHLRNVCYTRVEENQPFIQLLRIDDEPLVVKKYQESFEYFFSRLNDETYEGYGKKTDSSGHAIADENFPLYHAEEHVRNENAYILEVFKKHQGIKNVPVTRNKIIQTRRPETVIKYSNQNQIILQEMYADLLMYKVPIQMVVNQKISAHISFTTKPTLNRTEYGWADKSATDVVAKPKLLSLLYTPPVIHFFGGPPSKQLGLLKPAMTINKAGPHIRTKNVPKTKAGVTKTTVGSGVAAKVSNALGAKSGAKPGNRPQIFNITQILTAVTSNQQAQIYSAPKTVMHVTHRGDPQMNLPVKHEVAQDAHRNHLANRIMASSQHRMHHPHVVHPPHQNIVFKIPFNPTKTGRNEPPLNLAVKEEQLPPGLGDAVSKHIVVNQTANKVGGSSPRPNLIFRFPYNANHQNHHGQLYQTLTSNAPAQNGNANVYLPQGVLRNNVHPKNHQYFVPTNSQQQHQNAGQNGLQFRNLSHLNNLLLLKNGVGLNHSNPNHIRNNANPPSPIPSNLSQPPSNGGPFYTQRNSVPSPINSTPSPINSSPSPINSVPSPINSISSSINTAPPPPPPPPYTTNSFSSGITSITYSTDSFPSSIDSVSYTANSFPPSDTSVSYSTDPYPPYTTSSFSTGENSISYSTDTFPPINSATYSSSGSSPYTYPGGNSDSYTPNAYPPPSSDSYSSGPFPSDSYSPNSFQASDAYAPNSYPSTSFTPPQYNIPPYNPLGEFGGFSETSSMHMLPPQHLNTSAVGGKVFLRVKQPWELNQA